MKDQIKYRSGYKYQLAKTYLFETGLDGCSANTEYLALSMSGLLTIRNGYAWDGPSGLTFDTLSSMRGSLIHDALYQLMRQEILSKNMRTRVDIILRDECIKDGMWKWRANAWFKAVNMLAVFAADPKNKKKILVAPEV